MGKQKSVYDELWSIFDQIDTWVDNIADHVKDSKYSGDDIYEELQELRKRIMG